MENRRLHLVRRSSDAVPLGRRDGDVLEASNLLSAIALLMVFALAALVCP
jgi:hypothetical protein